MCAFWLQIQVASAQGYAQDTTKAGSNSAPATGENLQAAARDHGGPISGADMAARGATNAAAAATKVRHAACQRYGLLPDDTIRACQCTSRTRSTRIAGCLTLLAGSQSCSYRDRIALNASMASR